MSQAAGGATNPQIASGPAHRILVRRGRKRIGEHYESFSKPIRPIDGVCSTDLKMSQGSYLHVFICQQHPFRLCPSFIPK